MLSISEIIRLNAETYYDFSSNKKRDVWPRYLSIGLVSLGLSYVLSKQSDNLCLGIITAQSILVGFSFNILFFLAANRKIIIVESTILEKQARADRINILGKEIFYNVSYYNVIALSSVVLSIILLTSSSVSDMATKDIIDHTRISVKVLAQLMAIFGPVSCALGYLVLTTTYFTLIESILTFFRTVQRITYYFDARIKLGD